MSDPDHRHRTLPIPDGPEDRGTAMAAREILDAFLAEPGTGIALVFGQDPAATGLIQLVLHHVGHDPSFRSLWIRDPEVLGPAERELWLPDGSVRAVLLTPDRRVSSRIRAGDEVGTFGVLMAMVDAVAGRVTGG